MRYVHENVMVWAGIKTINICGFCSIMLCGWLKVNGISLRVAHAVKLGGNWHLCRRLRQVSSARTHIGPSVQLSAIIIRACDKCEGPRAVGEPCAACGNREPAEVVDLGVIASHQKSWWERVKWNVWGYHVAQRRIRNVNKDMLRKA